MKVVIGTEMLLHNINNNPMVNGTNNNSVVVNTNQPPVYGSN